MKKAYAVGVIGAALTVLNVGYWMGKQRAEGASALKVQWEYKVVVQLYTGSAATGDLDKVAEKWATQYNELSNEGWEWVGPVYI